MKISIIIPVYNCENFLEESLYSVLHQSEIPNEIEIEVIIVDDGSTDKSGIICDRFTNSLKNIKVFHQENKGVSAARNLALDNITGNYVMFLDGDDILDSHTIKALYEAKFYKYDQLYFGMFHFIESGGHRYNYTLPNIDSNKSTELRKIVQRKSLSCVCGGVYKRNLFEDNNIRFQEGIRMGEDWQVAFKLMANSTSYALLSGYYYGYRDNPESATKKAINYVRPDALIALNDIIEYANGNGISIQKQDVEMARSDFRRNMMKATLYNHLFKENDEAMRRYGNQSIWKDLKYSGTLKRFCGFILYYLFDAIVRLNIFHKS